MLLLLAHNAGSGKEVAKGRIRVIESILFNTHTHTSTIELGMVERLWLDEATNDRGGVIGSIELDSSRSRPTTW